MTTPRFKVYSPEGEYVAATKRPEDALILTGAYGVGAEIRDGHRFVVWHEGSEDVAASESYDAATEIISGRINPR